MKKTVLPAIVVGSFLTSASALGGWGLCSGHKSHVETDHGALHQNQPPKPKKAKKNRSWNLFASCSSKKPKRQRVSAALVQASAGAQAAAAPVLRIPAPPSQIPVAAVPAEAGPSAQIPGLTRHRPGSLSLADASTPTVSSTPPQTTPVGPTENCPPSDVFSLGALAEEGEEEGEIDLASPPVSDLPLEQDVQDRLAELKAQLGLKALLKDGASPEELARLEEEESRLKAEILKLESTSL